MSTSLAEQLRRLAVPQTAIISDSKKRASILFDAKEAATKDRETIYDIGRSGLDELITMNPAFIQFEQTLFNRTAKDIERSVETTEVNQLLDKTIKKFLFHLSPYFLLQPAHKCLEWLIRRFHINEFNKDQFMALILPYYSTKMFVKCLQTMPLRNPNDKWHWLDALKKPGIPLSKQTLFNRATVDGFLLNFICETTIDAVKELDSKSYTLQTIFGFYCTTILGVLDTAADVTDVHVSAILPSILKGLSSNVVDFIAASLMITAQLIVKTKLSIKFLTAIVRKLLKIAHAAMQSDAITLLILIFKTQGDGIAEILNQKILAVLVNNKSLPIILSRINTNGINVLPFYIPLLSACIKHVQWKSELSSNCMELCENLLQEVVFTGDKADDVIRCILNSYIRPEKDENDIITIESDDEDGMSKNLNQREWFSEMLKKIERQYPDNFDQVTKSIMLQTTDAKTQSLKHILGFLFTTTCSEQGSNIFENLYHYNVQNRIDSIRYLVSNFNRMNFTNDSKDLMQNSIGERINDESPLVVAEVLKFKTDDLIQLIGKPMCVTKLINVIRKGYNIDSFNVWHQSVYLALAHLTSNKFQNDTDAEADVDLIFVTIVPYFYMSDLNVTYANLILNSDFAQSHSFLCDFLVRMHSDQRDVCKMFMKQLSKNSIKLPTADKFLRIGQNILMENTILEWIESCNTIILLMAHTIPDKCSVVVLHDILRFIESCLMKIPTLRHKKQQTFSIDNVLLCIERVYKSLDLSDSSKLLQFDGSLDDVNILTRIFNIFIMGLFGQFGSNVIYGKSINQFLHYIFTNVEDIIEFCTNYFIERKANDFIHTNDGESRFVEIDKTMQIRSIRFFNSLINQLKETNEITLRLNSLMKICSGLTSTASPIRQCTIETLEIIGNLTSVNSIYVDFVHKLLSRKEELLMDEHQLALIVFRIFNAKKSADKQTSDLMTQINNFISDLNQSISNRALILDILKHVTNIQLIKRITPNVLDILQRFDGGSDKTDLIILSRSESIIIRSILYRCTAATISSICRHADTIHVICKLLEHFNVFAKDENDKLKSLAVIAMDIFQSNIFDELNDDQKVAFLIRIIEAGTFSDNPDVVKAAAKFIKKIDIDGKQCLPQLIAMKTIQDGGDAQNQKQKPPQQQQQQQKLITTTTLALNILNRPEWKCGLTWLEYLQNKKRLTNAHILIPHLFDILKKCTEFEAHSSAEYAKQLTLATILHCCQIISPYAQPKRDLVPDTVFKIDSIVKCIRSTQNAQTHHHALQLLSHAAAMIPEQVLLNITEIFTFMGSTVVRRDDAYTYQIISNIIKSIIPTLIKGNGIDKNDTLVIPVLRLFSDIILDVPEHRRLQLYTDLLQTLDAQKYLWMFLVVLFESHVRHFDKDGGSGSGGKKLDENKRIFVAIELANKFDSSIVIDSCSKLFDLLNQQPAVLVVKDSNKMDVDITDKNVFNLDNYTDKQLRHFRYITLQFICFLTRPSSELATKISMLDANEMNLLKPYFKDVIVKSLKFLGKVIKAAEQLKTKYWKQFILHYSYDILEQIIGLLSPDMLLQVVAGLLNNITELRKKAIELLNKKLQQPEFFVNCEKTNFFILLDHMVKIIESINDPSKLCENATVSESIALQQNALIAIKLLSMTLAGDYPEEFTPILQILSQTLKKTNEIPANVLGQLVLCLAEVCSNLRAHTISHLSKFMPAIGKLLEKQITNITSALTPILVAVYKIVETLPLFLSPYLVNIIVSLSAIWCRLQHTEDVQKKQLIIVKFEAIWFQLSSVVPIRVLIPIIDQCYDKLMEQQEYASIANLMKLLYESVTKLPFQEISPYQTELTGFFVKALKFRSNVTLKPSDMNEQEDSIIQAFIGLVLKMSESSFRPLFNKVFEWAITDEASINSTITFYRLSAKVADSLKSLFILFANDFIQNAADLLKKYSSGGDADNQTAASNENICNLIGNIIETLYNLFLHDSQGFINNYRFDILMQPIVDQLENDLVVNSDALKRQLCPCLAQMAKAVNDDTMWKQLNYQILLKTRNNNEAIRLFALEACVEVGKKLGDDFLPLLPETVPFLAELMEDESPFIEKKCQTSIQELEQVLGESLQKYF